LSCSLTGTWAVGEYAILSNRTFSIDSSDRLAILQAAASIRSGSPSVATRWAVSIGINILDAVTPSTVLANYESDAFTVNGIRKRYEMPNGLTVPDYTNGVIIEYYVKFTAVLAGYTAAFSISKPKLESNFKCTPYVAGRPSPIAAASSGVMSNYFTSVSLTNNAYVQMPTPTLTTDFASVDIAGLFTALKKMMPAMFMCVVIMFLMLRQTLTTQIHIQSANIMQTGNWFGLNSRKSIFRALGICGIYLWMDRGMSMFVEW